MIGRQTLALFLDAYRELNARKLFWIVLIISGIVVAAFGAVGYDEETGLYIFHWSIGFEELTRIMSAEDFYKLLFVNFGISIWLAWIATILALVSTASIYPDLVAGGSIDLLLSKPIGRMRLFLTKYATGLLFVALQVTVFTVACFFVIGWRGGSWEFGLFIAIPVMVVFFSYIFAVCALFGIMTRSTIAALLLTLLVWFLIFGVHLTELQAMTVKHYRDVEIEFDEREVERLENRIVSLNSDMETLGDDAEARDQKLFALKGVESDLDRVTQGLAVKRDGLDSVKRFQTIMFASKTVLPKTAETIELLNRWLVDSAGLFELGEEENGQGSRGSRVERETQKRVAEEISQRPLWWVIATSLGFEAFVLALAGWIFCRRDY